MGLNELKKYRKYGRPMNENDRKKAETLMDRGMYMEEDAIHAGTELQD